MAENSKVVFTSIKHTTELVNTGNENSLLALAISGASQAKLLADFSQGYQTGQTRNSIQFETGTGKEGGFNDSEGKAAEKQLSINLKKDEAAVGATTGHASYVEFGTRKQAPQPFLRPSIALIAGQAKAVIAKKMQAEFDKGPLKYGQKRETFQ